MMLSGAINDDDRAVRISNPDGRGIFVVVCDHASNYIPPDLGTLGLPASDLDRHIAWDPGARPVAEGLSQLLDAPLVASGISRLVIDCNRPLDAPNLFWTVSEDTAVPGNQDIDADERRRRISLAYDPFHDAVDQIVARRLEQGLPTALIAVHSFTPVYNGISRPWEIGIIHDEDDRIAVPLIAALQQERGLTVGVNEPYSPSDKVYFTIEKHARSRGIPCVMIEIRNDEIADSASQQEWAGMISRLLGQLDVPRMALSGAHEAASPIKHSGGGLV